MTSPLETQLTNVIQAARLPFTDHASAQETDMIENEHGILFHGHRDLEQVVDLLMDAAYDLFCTLGYEKDFCLRYVEQAAVFGNPNRVIWNPKRGWSPDVSFYSEDFLIAWNAMFPTWQAS